MAENCLEIVQILCQSDAKDFFNSPNDDNFTTYIPIRPQGTMKFKK